MNRAAPQPVVLITGAAGNIGSALVEALAPDYTVVGLDPPGASAAIPLIPVDLASDYFDFTGDESPLSLRRGPILGRYAGWDRYIM